MRKCLAAASVALALPHAASAEGFSVMDLGGVRSDRECADRARRTFNFYKREVRAGSVRSSQWTIALYNIHTSDYDALIICNSARYGRGNALLIVYADDFTDNGLRQQIARRLREVWRRFY